MAQSDLNRIADQYAVLEKRVQRIMKAACAATCSACAKVCCKPEMCAESLESPFLVLVRKSERKKAAWNQKTGWLGGRGCRLDSGRPPVCYEFLCQDILDHLPDDYTRTRLKALARLLTQAGQRALGRDHLVEIMTLERLALVKPGRLAARFDLAITELAGQEAFWLGREAPKR